MSHYHDGWGQSPLPSSTVTEENRWGKICWRSEDGKEAFRAIVKVKPNPIGFTARLPGTPTRAT